MTKEKQIEEIEIALREAQHELDKAWHECLHNKGTQPRREFLFTAQYLVENKGYRKASDVAREIFEDFRAEMRAEISRNEALFLEDEDDFYEGRNDAFRTAINFLAELKKKYTEGAL